MNDFFSEFDDKQSQSPTSSSQGSYGKSYAEEVFSKKIEAKYRTYFIDLKQSMHGKFVKVSERSNGRKNTIMIDAEYMDDIIKALQEARDNI